MYQVHILNRFHGSQTAFKILGFLKSFYSEFKTTSLRRLFEEILIVSDNLSWNAAHFFRINVSTVSEINVCTLYIYQLIYYLNCAIICSSENLHEFMLI